MNVLFIWSNIVIKYIEYCMIIILPNAAVVVVLQNDIVSVENNVLYKLL